VSKSDLCDVEMYLTKETDKAFGVTFGKDQPLVWLPKSQCEVEKKTGSKTVIVTLPEWLAQEKELI
jgi:hypothetical protein